MNKALVLRYLAALFFYAMLALGAYFHWWSPSFLETALESGLVALGVFHSVNYGALNLTGTPPVASDLPAAAPTAPAVPTSTQGDTHVA